jgi:hypothetical protein
MKMKLALSCGRLQSLVLAAALLTAGSAATVCKAASFNSPVGTWDFISAGSGQQGLAYLAFDTNNTFTGYVLIAGHRHSGTTTGRDGVTITDGRGGTSGSSNSSTNSMEILFGFTSVNGPWHFDDKGRVVGFFTELVNVQSLVTNFGPTNVLESIAAPGNGDPGTNVLVFFPANASQASITVTWDSPVAFSQSFTFDNPNFTVAAGSAELTNGISFTGKVSSGGKHFSLVSSTSLGKVTYKGVPAVALMDFSGVNWNATIKSGPQTANEFFTLATPLDPAFPNIYPMTGVGPGYDINGTAVFSRQKKAGFTSVGGTVLRSTFGTLKISNKGVSAKTTGTEDPGSTIKYNASIQPTP